MSIKDKKKNWLNFIGITAIVLIVNFISNYFHTFIDLTEDKRFTLTNSTKESIKKIDEIVYIKVLLDGEFPSAFRRLQNSTKEILDQIKSVNPKIQFEFEDPLGNTPEINKKNQENLAKDGIIPTSLKFYDGNQYTQKPIYPYALLSIGNKKAVVNLLEEQIPGMDEDVIINNSISLLEYKFANTFNKMLLTEKHNIAFSAGNGELKPPYNYRLNRELRRYYDTGPLYLDSLVSIDTSLGLLIIAAPKQQLSLESQFKIDQYLMRGGKILWLIEKLDASLDSIAKYKMYVPRDVVTGVDDLLFKYGIRIQPNLIVDMECSQIPQVVGMSGDKPQTIMFPWYYHLSIASPNNHIINRNVDRVNMFFPSSIDTLPNNIKKTVLLKSSKYSRTQFNPVRLNFEILKYEPDPKKFNDGGKAVAVLLEGSFESAFKNRVPESFRQVLQQLNTPFLDKSIPTKQIVISDVDFMKNLVNPRTNETEEIGFNKWEVKYYKGNKDFIVNAIEYLMDDSGVLESRSKEVKLRVLDKVKVREERKFWQFLNLIAPLIFLGLVGLVYTYLRKKKYAS